MTVEVKEFSRFVEVPRCEAKLSWQTMRYKHANWEPRGMQTSDTLDQCGSRANYLIDGVPFCRKHGGLHLLDLLAQ